LRIFLTFLTVMGSVVAASAAEIEATSSIDTVTVYPDGATVTRVLKVNLPAGENVVLARDFPLGLDPASIRVEGEGGARVQIGSIDARPPAPQPVQSTPEREKRLQALQDEGASMDDRISAANVRKGFARRFATDAPLGLGEESNARPLAEWREAFKAIEEEISRADETIRGLQAKKREIDAEIAILKSGQRTDPPRKMEVRIDLAAQAAGTATLRVSYSVRDARWMPLYDARLDTGAKDRKASLELVRRAEIVQRTGEDWANVELAVSTVRTARGGSAPNLNTVIVRYPQPVAVRPEPTLSAPPRPVAPAPATSRAAGEMVGGATDEMRRRGADAPEPVMERSAVADVSGFQAVFRIPGRVSLGAGEGARSLRIASMTAAPDLLVRAAPVVDSTAYLEASFKQTEEAPLLAGRVSLYRDGTFVGRGQMPASQKDETMQLGFGADEQVKVTRSVARKNEGSAGIITSSKTDEREFKIVMRNGHTSPVKVTIEEQLPIAENSEIQVEMLPSSTQPTQRDVRDQRGVMAWTTDVPAGETREVKFGWRVRWPTDKTVVFGR
jgi:uncharacterized protein (TIGR02231 family)